MKKNIVFIILFCIVLSLVIPMQHVNDAKKVYQHHIACKEDLSGTEWKNQQLVTQLPIFIIHADPEEIPGKSRHDLRELHCMYSVIDNHDNMLNNSEQNPVHKGNMHISIRGRSTRLLPKKQYSIGIVNQKGESKKVSLMQELPSDSSWVLNGSFIDHSMLRNYMIYTLSGEIMHYSPRAKLCEVLWEDKQGNYHYEGVYTAIEKIKVAELRLDLTEYNRKYRESAYVVQLNDYIDNYRIEHLNSDGLDNTDFDLEYPDIEEITEGTKEYIKNDIAKTEKTLIDAIRTQDWKHVDHLIDYNSFAEYFIINEFFQNYDATALSTYLYKDLGDKLHIGPVWDFDGAMNNFSKDVSKYKFELNENFYYFYLFQNPEFVTMVQNKYKSLRKSILSEESLLTFIEEYDGYMKYAAERNCNRWYEGNYSLYADDIEEMKNYIAERGAWMDKHIYDLDVVRLLK